MAEYKSLSQQPPADKVDGVETSIHQSTDSIQSTSTDSISRGDSRSEQGNAEMHASDSEWTSPAEFIESQFRSSIDISTLTAFGWVNRGSHVSNDSRLKSVTHGHGRTESVDSSLSQKLFLTQATELAVSRTSVANLLGRKLWNPIWLTASVLVSFAVLFVGLFFVVLVLYLYSEAHSGLL